MSHDLNDMKHAPTGVYNAKDCPQVRDAPCGSASSQRACSCQDNNSQPPQASVQRISIKHHNYIDYFRAFGALAVIGIHVLVSFANQGYVSDHAHAMLTIQSCISIGLFRWAVPIFFMISGSLMLDPLRHMSLKKVCRHIWRVGSVLLCAGMVFSAIELIYTHEAFGAEIISASFMRVLQGNTWGHLWFLYSLLGLYVLIIPLRYLCSRLSNRQLGYLIAIMFVLCFVIPWGTQLYGIEAFSFPFACDVVYFVAGLFFARVHVDVRVAWICGFFSLLAMCSFEYLAVLSPAFMPESPWMLVYSVALFSLVKNWFNTDRKKSREVPRIIRMLSHYSFGIYVFHVLFLHIMMYGLGNFLLAYMALGNAAFDMISLQAMLPLYKVVAQGLDVVRALSVWEIPLYVFFELVCAGISLFGSCALTWALRKIPYVDRVL